MLSLDIVAMGVPIRFHVVGEEPERTWDELRRAWSRCLDLPVLACHQGAAPSIIEIGVVGASVVEVNESLVMAYALGDELPSGGTSRLARHRVESLLVEATKEVTLVAMRANRGRLLMLHAAALVMPGGGAVGFVAPSGTGKTTLTRTLGRSWGYLSDETLAVDEDGVVVPYPKPLSIIRPEVNRKAESGPDDLGLVVPGDGPFRLRGLFLLDRVPGNPVAIEPVPTPAALVALAAQASSLVALEAPLSRLAGLWEHLPAAGRLTYGEAADVAGQLPGMVKNHPKW